jgi:tyrosine-protein phosphatase SIW14
MIRRLLEKGAGPLFRRGSAPFFKEIRVPQRSHLPWIFGIGLALFMTLTPFFYYRWNYTFNKRLRVVAEGKLYRSGCLTADGFEEAIKKYGIRTILNLQEEAPDPDLPTNYLGISSVKESELCKRYGVKYEFLFIDTRPPNSTPPERPESIDKFLALMDDPANYPILVHCRAGLHRTGVLMALYRMEYDGWSSYEALTELRGHGFGRTASYAPNDYIWQYVIAYQPRHPRVAAGH